MGKTAKSKREQLTGRILSDYFRKMDERAKALAPYPVGTQAIIKPISASSSSKDLGVFCIERGTRRRVLGAGTEVIVCKAESPWDNPSRNHVLVTPVDTTHVWHGKVFYASVEFLDVRGQAGR